MKFLLLLSALLLSLPADAQEPSHDESLVPSNAASPLKWETLTTNGQPNARHEASLVGFDGKLFLLGGRRINPVDVYDPVTNAWTAKSPTPMELHHFQGVVLDERIFLMGAMTGSYPRETPLEKIVVYYPNDDRFKFVHAIPESRRRGGAGAVSYDGKIYLIGGITNGHMDGCRNWFDRYDPATGDWDILPDAPTARDHFQAVMIDDRLYAAGGRQTSKATNEVFSKTIAVIDVFDFKTGQWLRETECPILPTPRAGNSVAAIDGKLVIAGGETGHNKLAHDEVEVYDPKAGTWSTYPRFQRGRHGSGLALIGDHVYTASGSGGRGGGPELTSTERLFVASAANKNANVNDIGLRCSGETDGDARSGTVTSKASSSMPDSREGVFWKVPASSIKRTIIPQMKGLTIRGVAPAGNYSLAPFKWMAGQRDSGASATSASTD